MVMSKINLVIFSLMKKLLALFCAFFFCYGRFALAEDVRTFELVSPQAFGMHAIGKGSIHTVDVGVCINIDEASIFLPPNVNKPKPITGIRLGLAGWQTDGNWDIYSISDPFKIDSEVPVGDSIDIKDQKFCLDYQSVPNDSWVMMDIYVCDENCMTSSYYAHEPHVINKMTSPD